MPARPFAHRDDFLSYVQQDGLMLGDLWCVGVQGPFHEDRDIVLAAVQQNGIALEYAAEPLKADRGIVLAAVQQNGIALRYADEPLKADRDIVLAAVLQDGKALRYAAEPLKADRGIVLAAVQQKGWALQYAAKPLKADRDIVLAAVQQNGIATLALRYADEPLKADRGIVLAAVKQNGGALESAAEPLKADRDIVLAAVQQHQEGWALDASWSLKTERCGPNDLIYDAHTLHSDASFMLSASRLGVRAHTAVACILGADVLRELEAAASAHDRDLTLIAPAPAPVTELEAAASAQPSTSQSPSADELDGAPVPPARVAPRRTRGYTQQANERAKADKGGNKANPIIFGDSDDESSARTSKADDSCVDVESQEWKPLPPPPHDEVARVKREREEATQREVDSRWAEKDQRDEQERVRVKRERADSTGDIKPTKEVVNLTDELGPSAPFEVTDEQKSHARCAGAVWSLIEHGSRTSSIVALGTARCATAWRSFAGIVGMCSITVTDEGRRAPRRRHTWLSWAVWGARRKRGGREFAGV